MKVLCAAFFYLHVPNEKLPKRLSYKKDVQKMLMKLTTGRGMGRGGGGGRRGERRRR